MKKRIRETPIEINDISKNNSLLSIDERLKMIANLVIDRMIEERKRTIDFVKQQ